MLIGICSNTCNASLTQDFFKIPQTIGYYDQENKEIISSSTEKNHSMTTKTFKSKQFTALDPDAKVIKSV